MDVGGPTGIFVRRRGTQYATPLLDSRSKPFNDLHAANERGVLGGMTDVVHLRKHEAVRDCSSYEVWFLV
jgi:hypothetical protein